MKIKLSYLSLECRVAFAMSPGRSFINLANGSANSLVQFGRIEREEEEEIKDSGLRFTMWRIVTCAAAARSVLRA